MIRRVNIQYSIDLEQLPSEVDRIYNSAHDIFSEISLPNEQGKDILTADVLKQLDETRKKLTYLDHILSDVSGIVGSYVEYELSQRQNNQQLPPEYSQGAEHAAEMSE